MKPKYLEGRGLEVGLTHEKPANRAMARLSATDATSHIMNWADAEFKRGTEPVLVIAAMRALFAQMLASMVYANCIPEYRGLAIKEAGEIFSNELTRHLQFCEKNIGELDFKP